MATKKKVATAKKAAKPTAKKAASANAKQPAAKKAAPKKNAKPAAKATAAKKSTVKTVVKKAAPASKPSLKKPAVKPVAKTSKPTIVKKVTKPVPAKGNTPVKPQVTVSAKTAKTDVKVKPTVPKRTIKAATTVTRKVPHSVETPKTEPKSTVPPPPFKKAPVVEERPTKVVMPDIKTKSVKKYEPDFTKSVLDVPAQQQTVPTMRYSDAELVEFKELINKKLDAAKKELNYLQGLITRKDEMGGDESENRYMTMEDGGVSMEREQLSQMASRQITFIDHLEKALMRIENKTYGICRVTGKLIDKARLRAVPHATLSIEAKQVMNK